MKITEARLKELITEEVNAYLEEGWQKNLAALGIGAGMALGAGEIQKGVDARNQELSDRIAANVADAIEKGASTEGILENLTKQLDNTAQFTWDWGQNKGAFNPGEQAPTFPILIDKDKGTIGVLPPEFAVFKQVVDDFRLNQAPRYSSEDIIQGSGDSLVNRKSFPDEHNLPRTPDYKAGGAKGIWKGALSEGFKQWGVAGGYNRIIYLPADSLSEDYVMPISGMTKSEYYNEIWNTFVEKPRKRLVDNPPQ